MCEINFKLNHKMLIQDFVHNLGRIKSYFIYMVIIKCLFFHKSPIQNFQSTKRYVHVLKILKCISYELVRKWLYIKFDPRTHDKLLNIFWRRKICCVVENFWFHTISFFSKHIYKKVVFFLKSRKYYFKPILVKAFFNWYKNKARVFLIHTNPWQQN